MPIIYLPLALVCLQWTLSPTPTATVTPSATPTATLTATATPYWGDTDPAITPTIEQTPPAITETPTIAITATPTMAQPTPSPTRTPLSLPTATPPTGRLVRLQASANPGFIRAARGEWWRFISRVRITAISEVGAPAPWAQAQDFSCRVISGLGQMGPVEPTARPGTFAAPFYPLGEGRALIGIDYSDRWTALGLTTRVTVTTTLIEQRGAAVIPPRAKDVLYQRFD